MTGAVVSGGSSTTHSCTAGVGSALPAASVARTRNRWSPSASPLTTRGDVHEAKAPPSSEHSNVEPASSDENVNVPPVAVVGLSGPLSIVVSGGVVSSTRQARSAGVGSALPAASTARTARVWSPSATSVSSYGVVQAANGPPSSEHSKPSSAAPVMLSVPANANVAPVAAVSAGGPPVISVCGGVVSGPPATVHSNVAGSPSRPKPLVATTANACEPPPTSV